MSEPAPLANLIGGEWVDLPDAVTLDVPDPRSGRSIGRVPLSPPSEVDRAVQAARQAFGKWRDVPVPERARLILRWARLLERDAEALAELVVRENGKSLDEARASVARGIEATEFAAHAPTTLQGSFLEQVGRGVDTTVVRQPVGVVVGITPFNFPVMIPLWMAPLALVCGNAFILKPSERVPLSADRLARLAVEAGVPAGAFNLVHGGRETVEALLAHPGIDAVSFVGSAPTAETVYRTAAAHGKRVQALAGAKNHLIVLADADLERTVPAVIQSAFGQAGERCLAASVVVAVEPVGDELVRRLAEALERFAVAPVIREEHRRRVLDWIDRGVAEGARIVARGPIPADAGGFFVEPTVLDGVRPEMAVAQEEIFGPVLSIVRVRSLDEAIDVANRSRYGNAASIFTASGRAAREFRRRIEAGMLGINISVPAPAAYFPFAGWKRSFYGDLHASGRDAIEFYTHPKVVVSRWF